MTAHKVPPGWTGERYVPEIGGNIRFEHLHRYLIARELSRNKRVLDIACGEGYGAAILASVASHVVGVDIAGDVVAQASSAYAAPNVEFIEGSCEAIPLPDHAVDVVVSFETIEHVGDHQGMMRDIRRVLRPGGLLVMSSPDRCEYSDAIGTRNPFHVKELDREELERLLRSYFSNVALAGQRIQGGSIVGPLDESTRSRFVSFPSADSNATGVRGMHAPVYLLALASDEGLPAMPVGLLDGGAFTWQSNLEELLSQAHAQCAVEIGRRLGDVVRLGGATTETIRAEFIRQVDRVSALSHATSEVRGALAAAHSELAAAREHGRRLEEHVAELAFRLDILEQSHSWRLTAPFRAARRVLATAMRRVRSRPRLPLDGPTSPKHEPAPVAKTVEQRSANANRPSIVCVSHDAHLHGAQLIALNLVRVLERTLNYDVHVIMYGPGLLMPEFEAVSQVYDFARPALTREDKLAVVRELFARGARIAICNTSVVGEAVELFKSAGLSVVSLVHELPQTIRELSLQESVERIATHADHVVFPADMVRDTFRSLVDLPLTRCVVQPQGLFAPSAYFGRRDAARRELRARLGLPASARIVLGVGFADQRKGIDWFVQAGLRVIARRDDVVFVWVGAQEPSAFATVRARLDSAGSNARFLFPGPIRDAQLFYAGADAYLMTSREDPFPSVILEALDAGLPVIGFEGAGGFAELLRRGCGVLVPFGDTSEMAAALLRLLDSPAEGNDFARVGREILAREFSYVNYARVLVELVSARRPKVSVVVPNYNYARHLPARLKSIVRQTYPPHEIIFLDDCSSDDSVDVATPILHASGLSYRIITNVANQGTYRQWLRGMREATGDLIWIAEADDDCAPELLERLVPQFERPDVMLAYCQSRPIDEQGREIAPDYLAHTADISDTKWRRAYVRPGLDEITDTLVVKNTIPNVSAVLMRPPDLSGIEQQLLGLRNTGDWLVYVHILEQGSIAFVAEALNFHRRHSASVTIGHGGLNLMRETLIVQQHVLHRHGISPDVETKRQASLQATYEILGLHAEGPPSYRDHDSLRMADPTSTG